MTSFSLIGLYWTCMCRNWRWMREFYITFAKGSAQKTERDHSNEVTGRKCLKFTPIPWFLPFRPLCVKIFRNFNPLPSESVISVPSLYCVGFPVSQWLTVPSVSAIATPYRIFAVCHVGLMLRSDWPVHKNTSLLWLPTNVTHVSGIRIFLIFFAYF